MTWQANGNTWAYEALLQPTDELLLAATNCRLTLGELYANLLPFADYNEASRQVAVALYPVRFILPTKKGSPTPGEPFSTKPV